MSERDCAADRAAAVADAMDDIDKIDAHGRAGGPVSRRPATRGTPCASTARVLPRAPPRPLRPEPPAGQQVSRACGRFGSSCLRWSATATARSTSRAVGKKRKAPAGTGACTQPPKRLGGCTER